MTTGVPTYTRRVQGKFGGAVQLCRAIVAALLLQSIGLCRRGGRPLVGMEGLGLESRLCLILNRSRHSSRLKLGKSHFSEPPELVHVRRWALRSAAACAAASARRHSSYVRAPWTWRLAVQFACGLKARIARVSQCGDRMAKAMGSLRMRPNSARRRSEAWPPLESSEPR